MSSKPSTPVAQRRYPESESSRIPISLSPIPFRRTYSMRLRTNCLLNETTLKQHNRNILQARSNVDRNHQQLKLNLNYNRRGSHSMDTKSEANGIDSGGGNDEVDHSPHKHLNGNLRRSSCNKHDRGMVSWQFAWKILLGESPSALESSESSFVWCPQDYVIARKKKELQEGWLSKGRRKHSDLFNAIYRFFASFTKRSSWHMTSHSELST